MKNKILRVVFSISLILFLLLEVVDLCCFNRSFYDKEHAKLQLYGQGIAEYIGVDEQGLSEMTDFLLDYLEDSEPTLDRKMIIKGNEREIFNKTEKDHMVDVKALYLNAMTVRTFSGIAALICLVVLLYQEKEKCFKKLFGAYKNTVVLFSAFLLAIGVAVATNFDEFWTMFHKIFFRNDLWLLDLRTDVLIMIVPPEFFFHLVSRIVISVVLSITASFTVLYLLKRKYDFND